MSTPPSPTATHCRNRGMDYAAHILGGLGPSWFQSRISIPAARNYHGRTLDEMTFIYEFFQEDYNDANLYIGLDI